MEHMKIMEVVRYFLFLECKCKELFGICFRMTFLLVKGMIQSNDKFLINIKQNLINIRKIWQSSHRVVKKTWLGFQMNLSLL